MKASESSRSFWIVAPFTGELREEPIVHASEGQVRVRTRYSAVSRGTERLVFSGRVPESEHARMRAPFQQGEFTFPIKYGYANVGEVIEGPSELVGRDVFCLYPHQSDFVVPLSAVTPVPPEVPAWRAVLAANMETAVNATWDAEIKLGDRVTVIGAGVLGCLVAYLAARVPGTRVTLVDIDAKKAAITKALDVGFSDPTGAPREQDLVIHASGHGEGLKLGLELAAPEARVIELSWFGSQEVTLPLGQAFHQRRLTIRSSQVGQIPPSQSARWNYKRRGQLALSLLKDARLDALIDSEGSLEALPETMKALTSPQSSVLCHRVIYR